MVRMWACQRESPQKITTDPGKAARMRNMLSEAQITLFVKHVRRFLQEHYPQHSRHVAVAVSGGVDSILLMHLANELLKIGEIDGLRVLTVNHGTRRGQGIEASAVKFEAEKLELSCQILSLNLGQVESNIEETLRTKRHEALRAALAPNEELWMGHHLDDSWEWSQLQGARTSEVKSTLGIPLKAGRIVRPFLCVTRRQIMSCAQAIQIRWMEDPTNENLRFERNWVRRTVTPLVGQRHPQFLKHYARRSQAMAEELGLALKAKKKPAYSYTQTARSSTAPSNPPSSHN